MNEIALRYLGGAWIHGVPARDLTAAEAAQHGAKIAEQEAITGWKMYEPVQQPAAAPAKASKQAAATPQEE